MRKSIKEAIGTTVQDMLESGFKSSFTKEELKTLDVNISDNKKGARTNHRFQKGSR